MTQSTLQAILDFRCYKSPSPDTTRVEFAIRSHRFADVKPLKSWGLFSGKSVHDAVFEAIVATDATITERNSLRNDIETLTKNTRKVSHVLFDRCDKDVAFQQLAVACVAIDALIVVYDTAGKWVYQTPWPNVDALSDLRMIGLVRHSANSFSVVPDAAKNVRDSVSHVTTTYSTP